VKRALVLKLLDKYEDGSLTGEISIKINEGGVARVTETLIH